MDSFVYVYILIQNNLGEMGGMALAGALSVNETLRVLVVADNMIGNENMKIISGRLGGRVSDICTSVKPKELDMPIRYDSRRFNRIGIKEIMMERAVRRSRTVAIVKVIDAHEDTPSPPVPL